MKLHVPFRLTSISNSCPERIKILPVRLSRRNNTMDLGIEATYNSITPFPLEEYRYIKPPRCQERQV